MSVSLLLLVFGFVLITCEALKASTPYVSLGWAGVACLVARMLFL